MRCKSKQTRSARTEGAQEKKKEEEKLIKKRVEVLCHEEAQIDLAQACFAARVKVRAVRLLQRVREESELTPRSVQYTRFSIPRAWV